MACSDNLITIKATLSFKEVEREGGYLKIDSKVTRAHERRCQAAFKVNQPGESG